MLVGVLQDVIERMSRIELDWVLQGVLKKVRRIC